VDCAARIDLPRNFVYAIVALIAFLAIVVVGALAAVCAELTRESSWRRSRGPQGKRTKREDEDAGPLDGGVAEAAPEGLRWRGGRGEEEE
jgi:hypothetical protein